MSMKKKQILRTALALLCSVTLASSGISVYAAPSTEELEQKTSSLQGELDNLNNELASLSKELEETSAEIETLSADVEKAKLDLAAAKLNEESHYESMKDRIKFMYEGGSASLLEILFSSEDMGDFLNKAEYVSTISDYDRDMLKEFQQVRLDVEAKQKNLEDKQKELKTLQDNLSSQQETINSKISSTSGQLADYQAQLERAKAAEEAAKIAQNNEVSGSTSSGSSGGGAVNSGSSVPANTSDVALLAAILFCEAGTNYDGMLAVGTVIMNRVSSPRFPNSLRGVIYQAGQFSPASNGRLESALQNGVPNICYQAAKAILGGTRHSAVINCLYFNAAWTGKPGVNVGGNVFW